MTFDDIGKIPVGEGDVQSSILSSPFLLRTTGGPASGTAQHPGPRPATWWVVPSEKDDVLDIEHITNTLVGSV